MLPPLLVAVYPAVTPPVAVVSLVVIGLDLVVAVVVDLGRPVGTDPADLVLDPEAVAPVVFDQFHLPEVGRHCKTGNGNGISACLEWIFSRMSSTHICSPFSRTLSIKIENQRVIY